MQELTELGQRRARAAEVPRVVKEAHRLLACQADYGLVQQPDPEDRPVLFAPFGEETEQVPHKGQHLANPRQPEVPGRQRPDPRARLSTVVHRLLHETHR
jgi:hypothetical protein